MVSAVYCSAIMAVDSNFGVGKDNDLPWPKNKDDLSKFKEITKDKIVIMGRKTWESIGSKKLPNRINVVISSTMIAGADITLSGDLSRILREILILYPNYTYDDLFLIGGVGLVSNAHDNNLIKTFYLTCIEGIYACDIFLDKGILDKYNVVHKEVLRKETPTTVLHVYEKAINDEYNMCEKECGNGFSI